MGFTRNQALGYGAIVVVVGAIAMIGFGVPLGTLLVVGLALLCPLMMFGMHGGGGHQQPAAPSDRQPQ